jgi:hypothetical protein
LVAFFSAASSAGMESFSAATSAKSPFALSSSFAFFASPISFEAAFRRACAASAAWIAVRIAFRRARSAAPPAAQARAAPVRGRRPQGFLG